MGLLKTTKGYQASVLSELHSEGHAAAYYPEIVSHALRRNEKYMARRANLSNLLSKVGIHIALIPVHPLPPRPGTVYPALARLEQRTKIQILLTSKFQGCPRVLTELV